MTQSMVNEGKKKCNELKYTTVLPDRGFPAICTSLGCDCGEGNGTPLQYSCLENPMDGVAKSWTRLSNFTFTLHFHALEKEKATHSTVLAWRIPGTAEPGRLPSLGSHRVGNDWSDLAAAAELKKQSGQNCHSQEESKETWWINVTWHLWWDPGTEKGH